MIKHLLAAAAMLASIGLAHAHVTEVCAVVLKPPAKVMRDNDFGRDDWRALRDFGRNGWTGRDCCVGNARSVAKCGELEDDGPGACDDKSEWTYVIGIPRIDGGRRTHEASTRGFVGSKYVQEFPCPNEQEEEARQWDIRPQDLPTIPVDPVPHVPPGIVPKPN